MPMNSLTNLLDMFPYFFNKEVTSNFYKSQSVTNKQFQGLYQSLFDIVESFHLHKRCLIWREQSQPYMYVINFVANFPKLKRVTLLKNDDVIYSETFELSNNVNYFDYSYEHSTLNDVDDDSLADIIPQDSFKIIVETFEEYTITKGYPENDIPSGNEYDHDESLDEIGAFHNIPRKEYLLVNEELYPATEPPFNNKTTEDDYYYMKRIIEYLLRYHNTPLPVLELWKLYGIESTMENREKLLLKFFDIKRHPHFIDETADGDQLFSGTLNEETGEIIPWTPKPWEHLDKFCDGEDTLGKYFFVKASTKIPVKNQDVILTFRFLNSLAQELNEETSVDIILDGKTLYSNITESQHRLYSSEIPRDKDNTFIIVGKDSKGEIIGSQEVTIIVRGCNNGDFYVHPTNGNDNNDGKTRATAFRTIQKAVNSVNGDKNLIILLSGDYEINNPIIINKNCTIMGCGSVLIENLKEDLFFTLNYGLTLILQDLTLQYRGDVCDVTDTSFKNNNGDRSADNILILFTNAPILITTKLELNITNRNYCVGDNVLFTGTLKDKYGEVLSNKTVKVTSKDYSENCTTTLGVYEGSLIADELGELTLNAKYVGNNQYKSSQATASININLRLRDFLADYDYIVTDLIFEDNGDWDYVTKPVSEINTLADLNGAILNLQYNGYDVQFERFYSYSTNNYLSKTDMMSLRGLLVGIEYDPYDVKYRTAHIFGETDLTLTTEKSTYVIGETITFTGTLLDKYDNPIRNKMVTVNNKNYKTNSNGIYTGTLTPTSPGDILLNAKYLGDLDYDESHASIKLTVLISLASVLSDYNYVVTDLVYDSDTRDWDYVTKPVSEINTLADLNNCIMNLTRVGDTVQFERYSSSKDSENITNSELEELNGLLMAIVYDDYTIKYTEFTR